MIGIKTTEPKYIGEEPKIVLQRIDGLLLQYNMYIAPSKIKEQDFIKLNDEQLFEFLESWFTTNFCKNDEFGNISQNFKENKITESIVLLMYNFIEKFYTNPKTILYYNDEYFNLDEICIIEILEYFCYKIALIFQEDYNEWYSDENATQYCIENNILFLEDGTKRHVESASEHYQSFIDMKTPNIINHVIKKSTEDDDTFKLVLEDKNTKAIKIGDGIYSHWGIERFLEIAQHNNENIKE